MDISKEKAILSLLAFHNGTCSTDCLMKQLYLSRSTLRRVCICMEDKGLIQRYHGGVSLVQSSAQEVPITRRSTLNQAQKIKIARTASKLVQDNDVIFMDSSSTVQELCPYLRQLHGITVITNGIRIAQELSNYNNVRCYICPGTIKPQSVSVVGFYSQEFLANFHADMAFISCKAIGCQGIMEGNDQQAFVKRVMLKKAKRKILLCDASKQMEEGFFQLCGYDSIDALYTDEPLDAELTAMIESQHCSIVLPSSRDSGKSPF